MAMIGPALDLVLKNEGGLEENPKDPGGITNLGISLRFLKGVENPSQYGIYDHEINADTIRHLTVTQAGAVYQGEFWDHAPFGQIQDQDVASYIFDMAVNLGIAPAIKCCQRAIWAVWKHYAVIPDDGILGHDTLMWIERCHPDRLIAAMRAERAGEYRLIAAKDPAEAEFLKDWLDRAYSSGGSGI